MTHRLPHLNSLRAFEVVARHLSFAKAAEELGVTPAAGAPEIDASPSLHVNASVLAIQAAIDGQGVALGRSVLVHDDLAAHRLVKPFDLTFPLRYSYYIVYPRKQKAVATVEAFKRWLLAEAGAKE